ncbi:MAG: cyclase family protein [Phycisphaerae bacterium]
MLYDLTPPITDRLSVWPGDTPPRREVLLDMKQGANLTLSTLHATVHLGAHADGPNHYGVDAPSIDQRSLDVYLGPCQVIHVDVPGGQRISSQMLDDALRCNPALPPRVLLRTGTYPDPTSFNEDFAALSPELVDALHTRGVRLIGIDTPSVDLFTSKDLPSHKAFLRNDMAILEGIVLDAVPEGVYELIALPLRLVGFDASPVRAILRTLTN